MRTAVALVLLLALTGCSGDPTSAPRSTPSPAPASRPVSTPTATPTPTSAPPAARQRGLLGRLAADPVVITELFGREPRGVVLCGIDRLGHTDRERYAWLMCGAFRTGPDAELLSGGAGAVVIGSEGRVEFPSHDLPTEIDRLFPPDVALAIRHHDFSPRPAAGELLDLARRLPGGAVCSESQLSAVKLSDGGPAAGTFYTPLGITNSGPDCVLLDDDLVLWAGRPARRKAGLVVTGVPGGLHMRTGVAELFYVAIANTPCLDHRHPRVALSLSGPRVDVPRIPVTGSGASEDYVRCGGVQLIAAGHRVRPSR